MSTDGDRRGMAGADLVIRGATLIDPRDGSRHTDLDVGIGSDRIVAVAPGGADAPGGARVVDAVGKYLVPGFMDMHAHPLSMRDPEANLGLMLAFGVTGFRQMSGSTEMLRARDDGRLIPRVSPRLLAMPATILTPLNAATTEQALATIRQQHELGADFIKAGLVSAPVFYEAQAEAGRLGIPILGHLPGGIDVFRASGEGMRSIEHLGPGVGLLSCCSTAHDDIHMHMETTMRRRLPSRNLPFMETILSSVLKRLVTNPVNMATQSDVDNLQLACSMFDEVAAGALAERLAADETWQVPTLIRSRTNYLCDRPEFRADPNLRFLAGSTTRRWANATRKFSKFPGPSRDTFKLVYATLLRLAKLLDEAGVKMLAGSDACGAAWEVPGAALHQEFDELASAGLSPLRVLQMTTSDAADFLHASHDLGSVSQGRYADLVMLGADPLESVQNLHAVAGVVAGGVYYDADRLEAMKSDIAARRAVR